MQKPLCDLTLVPYISLNNLWLSNCVCMCMYIIRGHLSVFPFIRILFGPQAQLIFNTACLPLDHVSLLLRGRPMCGHQLAPSLCSGPCMCWLSLVLVASSGNSVYDDCQKHLPDHVMLSPGAEHPHFPALQVLFRLSPGGTGSFIFCYMSL